MKTNTILHGVLIAFGITNSAFASDKHQHVFSPYIHIINNISPSDAIEIRASEKSFIIPYLDKNEAFAPLSMPFEVISLKGSNIDYKLTLPLVQNFCEIGGITNKFSGVKLFLDGKPWAWSGSTSPGHEGYQYSTSASQSHTMQLTYPKIKKARESQLCYGTLGVQVEIVI
ncbi:hypothetical protein KIT90_13090 [Vibrio sp. B172a]|uniref:hypothetical protein n=1 Tax=Vibrio sp. B172a TaxID=2835790 RepID=UPI002557C2D9|nr:hypothetical protein [Vibrio sp. B172a]MDK9782317.1 hypothetical protein [Vibrio sp. B172a]